MTRISEHILIMLIIYLTSSFSLSAGEDLPCYLRDRGVGTPSSMFGTYIEKGQFIVYPYYEYYHDSDAEYSPDEFGYGLDRDFRAKYRAHEGLIFLGYGLTDDLAVELETAMITATQYRADEDPTDMPDKIEESGLGDVESQLRWRWLRETERRPGFFGYFETVFPLQKDKQLIGTQDWEFVLALGVMKGFRWGTVTFRLASEYEAEEEKAVFGEYAVEYLKRISPLLGFFIAVEGSEDEVELIADLQFHISSKSFIRLNNAFGLTSKATDYAPEFGILFRF